MEQLASDDNLIKDRIKNWMIAIFIPCALVGGIFLKWNNPIYAWIGAIQWGWLSFALSITYSTISIIAGGAAIILLIFITHGPEVDGL